VIYHRFLTVGQVRKEITKTRKNENAKHADERSGRPPPFAAFSVLSSFRAFVISPFRYNRVGKAAMNRRSPKKTRLFWRLV